jgi:hypothetical protein
MADLKDKLEQLHEDVVEVLSTRLQGEAVANEDIKMAMQLLKQNSISAAAMPETPASDLARMAGKLSFSALEQKAKVVPLRAEDQLSA